MTNNEYVVVVLCAGVFLLPYCFFAILCGLPVFLLETVVGQYTQEGPIACWSQLCPLLQGDPLLIDTHCIWQLRATIGIVQMWLSFSGVTKLKGHVRMGGSVCLHSCLIAERIITVTRLWPPQRQVNDSVVSHAVIGSKSNKDNRNGNQKWKFNFCNSWNRFS